MEAQPRGGDAGGTRVMMALEWRVAALESVALVPVPDEEAPATILERDRFHERLEAELDEGGFFISPEMAPAVKRNLRALFARAAPSSQEISTLHGVVQALIKRRDRRKSG